MDSLKTFTLTIGLWILAPPLHAQTLPSWLFVPCEGSPPGAVLEIPEPLNRIASVECTVFGHVITGSSEYRWSEATLHGGPWSFFVPAQEYVNGKLDETLHSNFFTNITLEKLEIDQLEAIYLAVTGDQPGDMEILSGSLITTKNQRGFDVEIFVTEVEFEDPSSGEDIQMTVGLEVRSDLSAPWSYEGYQFFTVHQGVHEVSDNYLGSYGIIPLTAVQAKYPPQAASEGVTSGYCIIAFTITTTGTTKDHTVEQCSNTVFEQESIRAAESLRYRPRTSYWREVETKTHYRFTFELDSNAP